MSVASQSAIRVLRRYGLRAPLCESDLDTLIARLGCRLVDAPASLAVPEFCWGHFIGVRRGERAYRRTWLKAHALGHYLLHAGDQAALSEVVVAQQEHQAEVFAGSLLRRRPAVW